MDTNIGVQGTSGPEVAGYDSIEAWAHAHGMELEDALDIGVWQDDDDVIHVPGNFGYEGYSE